MSLLNYQTPCTSSEGRLCNVFADLSQWNPFFWQVGLQLRECAPGELSLVEVRHAGIQPSVLEKKEAATILCQLLSHHRCIVSVHLNGHIFSGHHELICDALRNSPTLRKLKLCRLYTNMNSLQSFIAALPHLNRLQELEFSHVVFGRRFLDGLSEFLPSTRSLTALTMPDLGIEGEHAVVVLQGLRQNVTISALSLRMSLLNAVSSQCGDIFSDYLRCNQTLRSLTITSCTRFSFSDLRPVFGALLYNNHLSDLCLIGISLDMLNMKILTDMLSRNRGLRKFHLVNYDRCMNIYMPVFSSESSLNSLWLSVLAENNTLEELTMDLSWMKPEDCSAFFQALACNTSLKKINVPAFMKNNVAQICRALRDTGVAERFFVGEHRVLGDTAVALPECKALSRIRLYRGTGDEVEPLQIALCLLPKCSHVKSLCIEMTGLTFNGNVSSLIAQYVTDTRVLRELRLELFFGTQRSVDDSELALLQALSNNKSIRSLSLTGFYITDGETRILVETLQSSHTLCRLSFYPSNIHATTWLIETLSPDISSNYMLLDMSTSWYERLCGGWYPINDVVRRNNSLVTRAAHFVMGTRYKYCATAAELMQFNPGLVEKIQELDSIDEDEALSRIKASLTSFTELDDFMCLAGVVKDTVSCHRRDDGQMQFVDLTRDCWLHIRQYLNMGHILDQK
ncbi:uncharacterized protein LOC119399127 [Rhipicephalus sanguineus]|uniref:Nlr family card domain protein n=1 Tax=Rhipicephalus sanguineus TaxID=34632 RepID=A0A9D4SQ59_RHISA|nr:uncharacterized protein LOC119399127 [Rhipicephalus sanguineus]KAH7943015.1 hypothetical protein HPB52_003998 [Rhipicephalus sanguineus]